MCCVILDYWDHSIPRGALITIFFVPIIIINCFKVRYYGEVEFVCECHGCRCLRMLLSNQR